MECPECGAEMKVIAVSQVDENGDRWISYICPYDKTVVKVKE